MTKLLIQTQVLENYAVYPDGSFATGAEAYWKPKGGCDYTVPNVDECDMIEVIVDRVREQIECDNEGYKEYIVSYSIVPNDYLTEFERSQLEYEGRILYPTVELDVA